MFSGTKNIPKDAVLISACLQQSTINCAYVPNNVPFRVFPAWDNSEND